MTDVVTDYSNSTTGSTVGTGKFSQDMQGMIEEAEKHSRESGLRSVRYGNLFDALVTEYETGGQENFDNYGAAPVRHGAYREALSFIYVLPLDQDVHGKNLIENLPEVLLEPDGGIAFDWENENTGSSFAVSFVGDGKIYYAGLFVNGGKQNGSEYFYGSEISDEVIHGILRVFKEK